MQLYYIWLHWWQTGTAVDSADHNRHWWQTGTTVDSADHNRHWWQTGTAVNSADQSNGGIAALVTHLSTVTEYHFFIKMLKLKLFGKQKSLTPKIRLENNETEF